MEMYMSLDYKRNGNENTVMFYKANEKTKDECIAYFKALILATFYSSLPYNSHVNDDEIIELDSVNIEYIEDKDIIRFSYIVSNDFEDNEEKIIEDYCIQDDRRISKIYADTIFNGTNPLNLTTIDGLEICSPYEFRFCNNMKSIQVTYYDNGEKILKDLFNKED